MSQSSEEERSRCRTLQEWDQLLAEPDYAERIYLTAAEYVDFGHKLRSIGGEKNRHDKRRTLNELFGKGGLYDQTESAHLKELISI